MPPLKRLEGLGQGVLVNAGSGLDVARPDALVARLLDHLVNHQLLGTDEQPPEGTSTMNARAESQEEGGRHGRGPKQE